MAIELTSNGDMKFTEESIDVFVFLAQRAALKLETKGMRRRGRSALAVVRELTSLRARSAKDMLPLYEGWLRERGILA